MAGTRGKFISFEGGEGAGKSTQARMLRDRLQSHGRTVLLTREPGGSPGAEEIRKLLVEGEPERWTPLAETLLFIAARADHVARLIGPALTAGTWVVSDRFSDSTFVYQGIARYRRCLNGIAYGEPDENGAPHFEMKACDPHEPVPPLPPPPGTKPGSA